MEGGKRERECAWLRTRKLGGGGGGGVGREGGMDETRRGGDV